MARLGHRVRHLSKLSQLTVLRTRLMMIDSLAESSACVCILMSVRWVVRAALIPACWLVVQPNERIQRTPRLVDVVILYMQSEHGSGSPIANSPFDNSVAGGIGSMVVRVSPQPGTLRGRSWTKGD